MEKYRNFLNIVIAILILSFIFSLGSVSLAENPIEDKKQLDREEKITNALEGLVKKGILKHEDVEKIRDYLKIEREEKKKMLEQIKEMTEDERREFIRNYRKNKVNVWDKMVKDKVITQEQAEEIKKVIPHFKRKDSKEKNN